MATRFSATPHQQLPRFVVFLCLFLLFFPLFRFCAFLLFFLLFMFMLLFLLCCCCSTCCLVLVVLFVLPVFLLVLIVASPSSFFCSQKRPPIPPIGVQRVLKRPLIHSADPLFKVNTLFYRNNYPFVKFSQARSAPLVRVWAFSCLVIKVLHCNNEPLYYHI